MFQGWRQVVKGFWVCVLAILLVACGESLHDRLAHSVVWINQPESGSGVIFKREGNQYWVVTAAHVVDSQKSDFSDALVTEPDRKYHTIKPSQKEFIPNTDLAVLKFKDENDYAVAKIGDSTKLRRGQEIIVVGAPETTTARPQREVLTTDGTIIGINNQSLGYGLSYDAITQKGMSGGGVFDQRGRLIGIHGRRTEKDESKFEEGMPIQLLGSLAQVNTGIALPQIDLPEIPWMPILWGLGGLTGLSVLVFAGNVIAENTTAGGRRTFLGFMVLAVGLIVGGNQLLKAWQKEEPKVTDNPVVATTEQPTQDATPKTEAKSAGRQGEEEFSFETVQVNAQGEIIERVTKKAWQFVEDLGNGVMLEMVRIPTGNFSMGTTDAEVARLTKEYGVDWFNAEKLQHGVNITEEFYLGKFLVTQAQWQQIMGDNPSNFKYEGDEAKKYPVEQVSWDMCQEFLVKINNNKAGKTYRLPSEAEWEYACRAGTQTPFYFGETLSTEIANYNGNYVYGSGKKGVYREKTTEVGRFPANGFGLYDMHGNLWEWCEDAWHENYTNAPTDESAWFQKNTKQKVLRGGSWDGDPWLCRSANRGRDDADSSDFYGGFRVVCVGSSSP